MRTSKKTDSTIEPVLTCHCKKNLFRLIICCNKLYDSNLYYFPDKRLQPFVGFGVSLKFV